MQQILPTMYVGKQYHWLNDPVKAVLEKCNFPAPKGKCRTCGQPDQSHLVDMARAMRFMART